MNEHKDYWSYAGLFISNDTTVGEWAMEPIQSLFNPEWLEKLYYMPEPLYKAFMTELSKNPYCGIHEVMLGSKD